MTATDLAEIVQGIAPSIRRYVARTTASVVAALDVRLTQLEARALPEDVSADELVATFGLLMGQELSAELKTLSAPSPRIVRRVLRDGAGRVTGLVEEAAAPEVA